MPGLRSLVTAYHSDRRPARVLERAALAVVTPLGPQIGRVAGLEPVTSSDFITERLDAITVA